MPVSSNTADIIASNSVLNLVPNKDGVFKEIFQVLKPGGHFSISDIVLTGMLPSKIQQAAEMYAGCISGAIQKQAYLELISLKGFEEIMILKGKSIIIPEDILGNYLYKEELKLFKSSNAGIFSISVSARKPLAEKKCCSTDCCI